MNINKEPATVEVGSVDLFNYPFVHMTGHGNVVFSAQEAENLRYYLQGGGFLHIDDNYGMDKFVRTQMKAVFPDQDFIEIPFSHPIYHQQYSFKNGYPKFMNTMKNLRKVLVCSTKGAWFASIPTNVIWVMVGKMPKCIEIRMKPDRKL